MRGFSFGGHIGMSPDMRLVRSIPLVSFHHPRRPCWLWFLSLERCVADELRTFRYLRIRGAQDRRLFQFWNWSVQFVWQEEGLYRSPTHHRQARLLRLFGIGRTEF